MRTTLLPVTLAWLLLLGAACWPASFAAAGEPPAAPVEPEAAGGAAGAFLENVRDRLLARRKRVSGARGVEHKLVVVRLSEDLFTSFIDRQVDRQTEVRDVILQTPVAGRARTTGRPWVNLVPHDTQAAFEVVLEGTTVSRTVGRNGPAVIHSRCATRFRATKQVLFDPGRGFHALPAEVSGRTELVIEGIGSTSRCRLVDRLVRRRAWREARAKHGQALAIVHAKAERRVRSVFDEQLDQGLARLNRAGNWRQTAIALLAAGREPRYVCCSTEQYVEIAAAAGPDLPIELPPARHVHSPIQVWIHKSLVGSPIASAIEIWDRSRDGTGGLALISQPAAAALVGLQAAMGDGDGAIEGDGERDGGNAGRPPPDVDLTTVQDWIVVEIAQPGSRTSQALLRLSR